ncbi:MAG: AraC family transcriptional regulator [Candidatus Nanopelagicales bacterium]|nr:AraC family transcriptional regulator [Candidatus Nanopelagicales bacterium]
MVKTVDQLSGRPNPREIVSDYVGTPPPLEIIAPHPQRSFRSLTHDYPSEICGWHCHPEYEIHLITQTSGSVIVGNHIGTFEAGQIAIFGPNLPHDWVSDLAPDESVEDRDFVIQFTDSWIRDCMALIPELSEIANVLHQSKYGLSLIGESGKVAAEVMREAVQASGSRQVASLIELLSIFSRAPRGDRQLLAGDWIDPSSDHLSQLAVEEGVAFIFENLTGTISLAKAASVAHMSEATFSRYFKRASGITFSEMVKKLRIAHACRLLDSTQDTIATVATNSGYNNLANFNRQFLAEVNMTPREYRKLERAQRPEFPVPSQGLRADTAILASTGLIAK